MCFDKYSMYLYLKNHGVNTPLTFHELDDFKAAYFKGEIQFPVFIKPRTGSGSVGAHKVNTMQDLENYYAENAFDYIIQEFMQGDCDADAYIDYYSKEVVSIFQKRKLKLVSVGPVKLFHSKTSVCLTSCSLLCIFSTLLEQLIWISFLEMESTICLK